MYVHIDMTNIVHIYSIVHIHVYTVGNLQMQGTHHIHCDKEQ